MISRDVELGGGHGRRGLSLSFPPSLTPYLKITAVVFTCLAWTVVSSVGGFTDSDSCMEGAEMGLATAMPTTCLSSDAWTP